MHYYKILKHKAGFDEGTSYWEKLLARYLAATGGGKIRSTLPITFTSTSWKLASWTIYGNNTPNNYSVEGTLPLSFTTQTAGNASDWSISGNDNVGKNYYLVPNSSTTANVTFTTDATAGTVTASGTASGSTSGALFYRVDSFPEGNYYLSGCPEGGGTSSYNIHIYDITSKNRAVSWNKKTLSTRCYSPTDQVQVHLYSDHTYRLTMQVLDGVTVNDIVFKPMLRPADTSADFEPYQVGVGQHTINLFNATIEQGGLNNGAEYNSNTRVRTTFMPNMLDAGTYTINASGVNVVVVNYFDDNKTYTGGVTTWRTLPFTFNISSRCYARFAFKISYTRDITPSDISNIMLVEGSTAPQTYIPYGYEIPLTVNNTTQDIYVGSAPLTAGQSISKTSTGVDIAAQSGANTITTDLYNKPEMAIEGVDYVGVGEPINDSWQIPLAVTCDRNLLNIYGNMAYSGGVHTIDFNVETSSVTGEMSADSRYILGYVNAIVKGDETFVISFDKTTVGTAELRMMNGTGSSAEVIETFDISAAKSYRIVFECEESFGNVYPWLVATEAATNTFEHIMIKKASDKGGFVPYNAKYEYNVPIDAPLTEGQTVSNTMEIEVFEGENTIDTTLYNKPVMEIEYE